MLVGEITKIPNLFIVDLKSNKSKVSGDISQISTTRPQPYPVSQITSAPNLFIVELKQNTSGVKGNISQVITTKVLPHSIGATHLKADIDYTGADAEIWVFNCGGAEDFI